MSLGLFDALWLVGWALYLFGIYMPSARRFRRQRIVQEHSRPLDVILDFVTFIAWQLLPLAQIFTDWLDFADYRLPVWLSSVGGLGFAAALWIHRSAYRDLGANWSPKIDIRQDQTLVTGGIFARVRHPIYLGMWLWAGSQPLLIRNWIAGWAMLLTFTALYLIRMPREERMLLERFGDQYREYASRTPRLVPRRTRDRDTA